MHSSKPIAVKAELLAQQRRVCLPKHTHELIKIAKWEDQKRTPSQNSCKLRCYDWNWPEQPLKFYHSWEYHESGRMLIINILQLSLKGRPWKIPLLSAVFLPLPWGRCHLHPLVEHCIDLHGFACLPEEHRGALCQQIKISCYQPWRSECGRYVSIWVNTTSLPTELPGSPSLQNFTDTGITGEKKKKANTQTNTKDRKLLKLKIQSNHGYCVRLNKGKYLTLCPGFQMSSPKPVESVSDSWLFHLS